MKTLVAVWLASMLILLALDVKRHRFKQYAQLWEMGAQKKKARALLASVVVCCYLVAPLAVIAIGIKTIPRLIWSKAKAAGLRDRDARTLTKKVPS